MRPDDHQTKGDVMRIRTFVKMALVGAVLIGSTAAIAGDEPADWTTKLKVKLALLEKLGTDSLHIDVEADAWMGMIAPAHTPDAVVAKIQREVVEAIGTVAIRDKLAAQLMEPIGNTPAEFRARIDGEIARWAPVIKAANIKKVN